MSTPVSKYLYWAEAGGNIKTLQTACDENVKTNKKLDREQK